jgi:DNA-binding response OmpR family regulator
MKNQPMRDSSMARLLIVDDDTRLALMVADYLGQSGYRIERVADGGGALDALARHDFDVVVLDWMLPDIDGVEVCRRIRALSGRNADTGVVMLTAKGDPTDRVIGLEMGADDYLPKPFEPRELLARVRAVIRRRSGGVATPASAGVLRFGRLEIDRAARCVRVDGESRALTTHQFDLLVALAQCAGRVLSREQLMEAVGAEQPDSFDRSIDVHIARIRSVIEDDPKQPRRVITVRGAGYVFAKLQDNHALNG